MYLSRSPARNLGLVVVVGHVLQAEEIAERETEWESRTKTPGEVREEKAAGSWWRTRKD